MPISIYDIKVLNCVERIVKQVELTLKQVEWMLKRVWLMLKQVESFTIERSGNGTDAYPRQRGTDAATFAMAYHGAFPFINGANIAVEYTCDANGNLKKDCKKNS